MTGPSSRRFALFIGVGSVLYSHYGSVPSLEGYTRDVRCMEAVLAGQGYQFDPEADVMLNAKADDVLAHLKDVGLHRLHSGDIVVLFYSGHGALIPYPNLNQTLFGSTCGNPASGAAADRVGRLSDGAWCMTDRAVLGAELYAVFHRWFPAGVHILVISDSCYSGTVVAASTRRLTELPTIQPQSRHVQKMRELRPQLKELDNIYDRSAANKELYDSVEAQLATTGTLPAMTSDITLLAACPNNETTMDGSPLSPFTSRFLTHWYGSDPNKCDVTRSAAFRGSLQEFWMQLDQDGAPLPQLFCPAGVPSKLLDSALFGPQKEGRARD
jgi:metacaspase-1